MSHDHMEIGDSHLIPTPYGFYNALTNERLDMEGNPLGEDPEESTSGTDNVQDTEES